MVDSDIVLEGLSIAGFVVIGLSCISYWLRRRLAKTPMKQSTSQTDLMGIVVEDPQST
jgi:hypothetical protein